MESKLWLHTCMTITKREATCDIGYAYVLRSAGTNIVWIICPVIAKIMKPSLIRTTLITESLTPCLFEWLKSLLINNKLSVLKTVVQTAFLLLMSQWSVLTRMVQNPQNYLLLILELQVVNLWFLGRIFVFQAVISQLTTKANSIMFWASPWRFVAAQWRSQMFVSSHWPCTFSSGFCQWICESLRLLKSQIVNCSGNWREEMVLPWQTCSQTAGVVPPNQDQSVSSWVWFVFLLKVD